MNLMRCGIKIMSMKRILGCMRKAITDYNMIQDGDKIAVGLSGGKDSLTLLLGLAKLKTFLPVKFDLMAITLDLGFDEFDPSNLEHICKQNGITYIIKKTNIKKIVFDIRKEKNPCSLCANLRRGALHNTAIEYGFNKVALGHHLDDVLETFFLSLFYEGRIHTFSPVTYLSRKKVYVIRPMIYINEADIKGFVKKNNLPILHSPCPITCNTSREYMKNLIRNLSVDISHLRKKILGAIQRTLPDWKLETKN